MSEPSLAHQLADAEVRVSRAVRDGWPRTAPGEYRELVIELGALRSRAYALVEVGR